jgi:TRAP transporter TAXI family solute receptor
MKLGRSVKIALSAALVLVMVFAVVGCSQSKPQESKQENKTVRFSIGTAGTAGALYPMGVKMAEVITKKVPGFAATGEATAASVENLRNLHEGKMGWGIAATEIADMAYNGKGYFETRKMSDIRALFSTIYQYLQVFTKADSPINSIKDFKGKTIGVGPAGSGGEMAARMVLEYYGLTYKDIKPQFIPETEAVQALKDGKIDAFIATHPLKSAALVDLTTSTAVKMISIAEDDFYKKHAYYTKHQIPAGTYKSIDKPVTVPRSRIVMFTSTNAKFSEDDIYRMVKAIWENEEWKDAHASVKRDCNLKTALDEITVPLHPGAVKYFKEKGLQIPARLLPPQ